MQSVCGHNQTRVVGFKKTQAVPLEHCCNARHIRLPRAVRDDDFKFQKLVETYTYVSIVATYSICKSQI